MKKIYVNKENDIFQQILSIKENRSKRTKLKLFFTEGVQNIKDALENDYEIEAFIYSDESKLSLWAKSIISKSNYNYVLSHNLMNTLSDKSDTSEILAIIKMKDRCEVNYSDKPIILLLDRPSKKGNLGTIIRSADALRVERIYYSGHSVDLYDHNVITASMGSFFKLPITFISSNEEFESIVKNLRSKYTDLKLVATSLQSNNRLQDYDFTGSTLLLVGNETDGLSKYYKEISDADVKISMRSGIDSLNIACATTACLYEINRQRDFK